MRLIERIPNIPGFMGFWRSDDEIFTKNFFFLISSMLSSIIGTYIDTLKDRSDCKMRPNSSTENDEIYFPH